MGRIPARGAAQARNAGGLHYLLPASLRFTLPASLALKARQYESLGQRPRNLISQVWDRLGLSGEIPISPYEVHFRSQHKGDQQPPWKTGIGAGECLMPET